jgi:hypothetical protein
MRYTNNFVILIKIDQILAKMQPDDKEPKRGIIHSFFPSSSFEKKKVDTPTSIIDQCAQITMVEFFSLLNK